MISQMKFICSLLVFFSVMPNLLAETRIPIRIEEGKTSTDSIFGFNQDIVVEGNIEGDLGGIGCDIHVKGNVSGNISTMGGSILVYRDAIIGGNIIAAGGTVKIHESVQLPGKLVHYLNPEHVQDQPLLGTMKAKMAAYFGQTLFLFLMVILIFYVFPNQVNEASFQLSQDFVRPTIIGFVTLVVFILGLFISFLLMAVAIGFPLFMLFFSAFTVVSIYGAVVVFYRLGQTLERLTKTSLSLVLCIFAASATFVLLLYVPGLRQLLLFLLLIYGMGISIETRFGTNKQWFTRKTRYWSAG